MCFSNAVLNNWTFTERKMSDTVPQRGDIAKCSQGYLGLILCDEPQEVIYSDGTKGKAWIGIHLESLNGIAIGDPWSSRNPVIVSDIPSHIAFLKRIINFPDEMASRISRNQ